MSEAGEPASGAPWIRRVRIAQALIAVAILAVAGLVGGANPFAQWWFWVAATMSLTIAVVEPYFTGVTGALLFSLAALASALTANRTDVEPLWVVYSVIAVAVAVAALVAMASGSGRLRDGAHWIATRFGRPLWLGLSAVAIELLRQTSVSSMPAVAWMAIGTLLALTVATPDWYRLFLVAKPGLGGLATIETAVEPNLVLLTTDQRFSPGSSVRVEGKRACSGVVIGNLAHKGGNRIQVALDRPWYEVAQASGQQCTVVAIVADGPQAVAFVAEGTSDRTLSLRPFGSVTRGDTVYWEDSSANRKYLYQVLNRELARDIWDGAAVVAEHATAVMLGAVDAGGIAYDAALPAPYVPVFTAQGLAGTLPAGFDAIGSIAGTNLPFGISVDRLRGHHLAILGMSGMGKSTVARKVIELLSDGSVVIALDGTGEYRSRFGMAKWDASVGLRTSGAWVHELTGTQAEKASQFIEQVMREAAGEYATGTPKNRTLLLEEAHAYLPEWNFTAAKGEADWVAKSCRYILQARKFGLSFVLVSQRTAVISKSALSQCESYIILRTLDETSLQYVEGVLGPEFRETIVGLSRYQAVCVGPAFSTATPVVVNLSPFAEDGMPPPVAP